MGRCPRRWGNSAARLQGWTDTGRSDPNRGPAGFSSSQETPRDVAFCRFTIRQSLPMVVVDAVRDPRFRNNPLALGEPHIRFYAGAPIINRDGLALGSVCPIDTVPRSFGTVDRMVPAQLTVTALAAVECRQGEKRQG